jgi:hypothetical protein
MLEEAQVISKPWSVWDGIAGSALPMHESHCVCCGSVLERSHDGHDKRDVSLLELGFA